MGNIMDAILYYAVVISGATWLTVQLFRFIDLIERPQKRGGRHG